MCVLIFVRTLSEEFLIRRRIDRDKIMNVYRSSCTVALFLSDFNKTWFFWTKFRKILITFHENPSSGSRVVLCRRTERQT